MPRGGKRDGAGKPFVRVWLDEDHAHMLRTLALQRKGLTNSSANPQEIAQQLVQEWIEQHWQEFDEYIEQQAEEASKGERIDA